MEELHYVPGFNYSQDVTYFNFINRMYSAELAARSYGAWLGPHPWLMLFVPKSKVLEFDSKVFKGIVKDTSVGGSTLFYAFNRSR
jgi:cytokinin dehydrogenase